MGPGLTPAPPPLDAAARAERRSRVARLTRLVREGRYAVPTADIADAVIRFHLRER